VTAKKRNLYSPLIIALTIAVLFGACLPPHVTAAKANTSVPELTKQQKLFAERKDLFDKISMLTGIPWQYLAAVDQYERALSIARPKKRPPRNGLIAIYFPELDWVGLLNPDHEDTDAASIQFFDGMGKDGSGDGLADRANDLDVLYTMAAIMLRHGMTIDDIRIGLWEHYQNARSVERIDQFAKIYARFDTLDLHEHAFPLPLRSDYSYRSTWGASRSYGGYRIHEGTDLFAGYGVPVRSTSYGIIEVMGWNRYGGWRVGIRDLNNVYHYYAHLSGYNKEVKQGDIVTPGQVIGWVGSSGYGKPGTQGRFPPHLHFGLYRDSGLTEWSFDPYPYLRIWEREERKRSRKKK
jgi:murein DD-endopeptidase MepM/ murein hydrolase activator NlpD